MHICRTLPESATLPFPTSLLGLSNSDRQLINFELYFQFARNGSGADNHRKDYIKLSIIVPTIIKPHSRLIQGPFSGIKYAKNRPSTTMNEDAMNTKVFAGLAVWLVTFGLINTGNATANTVFADNFNDGSVDSSISTYGYYVSEHDGILDMQNSATDAGGSIRIGFAPVGNITVTLSAYSQDGGSTYFNPSFEFATSTGGSLVFTLQRHAYGWGGDAYNHPVQYTGGTYGFEYVLSDKTSSDYYNEWIDISMSYDMASGLFSTTFGNSPDQGYIQFYIPNANRDQVTAFLVNPAGWWTGHSMQIDNLVIATDSNSIPEPPTFFLLFGIGLAGLATQKLGNNLTSRLTVDRHTKKMSRQNWLAIASVQGG